MMLHSSLPAFLLHPNLYKRGDDGTFFSVGNVPYESVHEAQCVSSRLDIEMLFRGVSRWVRRRRLRVLSCANAVLDSASRRLLVLDIVLSSVGSQNNSDTRLAMNDVFIACIVTPNGKRKILTDAKRHMSNLQRVCNEEYGFFPVCVLLSIGKRGVVREFMVS